MRKVVVTGLGALTPIGNDIPAYWQGLAQGRSGAGPITYFDAGGYKTQFACELKGYRPEDHFEPREARKLDPCTQYALVAAAQALQDAQLDLTQEDLTRIGAVWGTGIGGIESMAEHIIRFDRSGDAARMHPFFIPKGIGNMPGGHIS
ncbi:MAG: beta-ketoacyl synthase N-terminal-like domain-containing protein, partial [Bacteroidota bacterium]